MRLYSLALRHYTEQQQNKEPEIITGLSYIHTFWDNLTSHLLQNSLLMVPGRSALDLLAGQWYLDVLPCIQHMGSRKKTHFYPSLQVRPYVY